MKRLVSLLAFAMAACSSSESNAPIPDVNDASDTYVPSDVPIETNDAGPCPSGLEHGDDGTCVPVVAAGKRRLALEINPPDGSDYAKSLDEALALGVRVYPITLTWSGFMEKTPGTIDDSWLKLVRDVTAPRDMTVALSIPMVDTVDVQAPSDLAPSLHSGALAFDDPSVIARYEKVIDVVYATFAPKPKVEWLVISNEVNVYLGDKPDARWTALRNFHDAIRTYVKAKHPETTVAISVTFGGISDPKLRPRIDTFVSTADVALLTYYFGSNGFGSPVGTTVTKDLETMLAFAGSKPLALKEFGYATGVKGNSPDGQALFVSETFRAWDANALRIPMLTFSRMWDGDRKQCEDQAKFYGLPGNEEFIQFLCTLGLRAFDGTNKKAFARFSEAAKSRGF